MTLEQVEQLTDDEIRRACALFRVLKSANAVECAVGVQPCGQAADYILDQAHQPRTKEWEVLTTRILTLGLLP